MQTENINFQSLYFESVTRFFDKEANRLNNLIENHRNGEWGNRIANDKGYKCIHLYPEVFHKQLSAMLKLTGINPYESKFLDVGCGTGQKLYLAKKLFGFQVHGLDLRQPFVDGAKQLLDSLGIYNYITIDNHNYRSKDMVFQANALTFNNYNEYDVIYFYCPIADQKLELQLELQIARKAKVGTIVLANLPAFFNNSDNLKKLGCFNNSDNLKKLGWKHIGDYNIFKRVELKDELDEKELINKNTD